MSIVAVPLTNSVCRLTLVELTRFWRVVPLARWTVPLVLPRAGSAPSDWLFVVLIVPPFK